ncbi:hypothetical protein L1049_024052 [Liquidambar formosana]|uniref:NAB domain-containing protein n=1 Tax=Liquidambar formosana TaxID=63359 RepID=A0AAP0WZ85_LIQFO
MLQRAASNAYSWWWASHIRTKQSKWLEQNLQDMEEKVENVLKLIEEDGDSFAKRAEMYYKKRPELVSFVEESYRAYRALAERYDHISTELQKANTTIASVFPEQVQFAMDEDEEDGSPKIQKKLPEASKLNIPKVPELPKRDLKGLLTLATKKLQQKKASKSAATSNTIVKSGLSKPEAVEEIDRLQKGILGLQTEKEFMKSSYEHGLAKYWEIEKQITETQEKICSLKDEFGVSTVIEDDEARTLMAAAALKSCQETLTQLHKKQEASAEEARLEQQRIKDARKKLDSLTNEFLPNQVDQEKPYDKGEPVNAGEKSKNLDEEVDNVTPERQELEVLREKIKEHFEVGSNASLTVTDMAEKIDDLVNKVISLSTAVLSQTALIKTLRTETDELQAQIRSLEDDKTTLVDGTNNLSNKLSEMVEKLHGIQDLNQNFEDQNNHLQTHFTEAHCNLDHLSEKLHSVKPDEELKVISQPDEELKVISPLQGEDGCLEVKSQKDFKEQEDTLHSCDFDEPHSMKPYEKLEVAGSLQKEEGPLVEFKSQKEYEEQGDALNPGDGFRKARDVQTEAEEDIKSRDEVHKQDSPQMLDDDHNVELREQGIEEEDELNWKQLFLNGLDNREKILLNEYTMILRNYKELKKNLSEVEKKNRDSLFEIKVQLKELKSANDMKDEQIRSLYQKLGILQTTSDEHEYVESKILPTAEGEGGDIKVILIDQPHAISTIEEKFRMDIDELLEENLNFWLRFSTSFHQIQKFQTEVEDLQAEILKLNEKAKKKQEGSPTTEPSMKSDARPIYTHLREIQTELTVWLEQSALLKDELQCRFSSLCSIQEEISRALKVGPEDEEVKFTSYQAVKFQGEVLNMKQENNKVAEELQAGFDHVTALQLEIEKTLASLNQDFGLSGSKSQSRFHMKHSISKSRVPLRSFIFGVKPKKHRPSIFSYMNPTLHRKYNHMRAGAGPPL